MTRKREILLFSRRRYSSARRAWLVLLSRHAASSVYYENYSLPVWLRQAGAAPLPDFHCACSKGGRRIARPNSILPVKAPRDTSGIT
jgi:hypothetical protein